MTKDCSMTYILDNRNSDGYKFTKGYYVTKDKMIAVLIGIPLFCAVLFAENKISSLISLACILFYYLMLFKIRPAVYFRYLHFFFGSAIGIAGCTATEFFEIELKELSDFSAFHGSLPLLIFSWWMFLATIVTNDERLNEKLCQAGNQRIVDIKDNFESVTKNKNITLVIAAVAGFVLIAFTYFMVFKNPSFKLGMDRFKYAKEFDYGFLYSQARRFIRYLIIPCIVVAIYKKNKIGWIALALYCLHALWIGEKFGALFSLLCMLAMIYSQKIYNETRKARKLLVVIVIAIIALVGVAVFAVSFTRDEGTANYLLPRAAQQGQLWWKTYESSNTYHIDEFKDELASIERGSTDIKENVGSQYGIYKIMYYTAPKTQIDAKLDSGSRYTEAGFPAAYYYFGIPGCIAFAVIGGILTSVFVNYFLYYLRYNQFVRAFIHLRLYTNMTVFMSMFIFFPFFNKTSALSYLILLLGRNKIFTFEKEQI